MDSTKQLLNALDPKYILKQEQLPVAQVPKPTPVDKALKISLESTADALKHVPGATAKKPEESRNPTEGPERHTNYKPIFNTFGKKESSLKRGKPTRKLEINHANTSEEINIVPTTVNPMYKPSRSSQAKSLRTRKRSRFSQSNNSNNPPSFLNTMLSPTKNKHVSFSSNTSNTNGNTRGMVTPLSSVNRNAFNKQMKIERPNIIKKRTINRNSGSRILPLND